MIFGVLFILVQIILFFNLGFIERVGASVESEFIILAFIFAVGPLMSIEMINHYNWPFDLEIVIMLIFSWFPAVLLYLGFFVIENKKYFIPLIFGLVTWPLASFFWIVMGA